MDEAILGLLFGRKNPRNRPEDVSSALQKGLQLLMQDDCKATVAKYGVGACGPRGFYGTIDVHLNLEVSSPFSQNNSQFCLCISKSDCQSNRIRQARTVFRLVFISLELDLQPMGSIKLRGSLIDAAAIV